MRDSGMRRLAYDWQNPSDGTIQRSMGDKADNYYTPCREVVCLLQRLEKELPSPFVAKLWSINRAVSLFHGEEYVGAITYDYVEDGGIVEALENAARIVAQWRADNEDGRVRRDGRNIYPRRRRDGGSTTH